MAGDKDETAEEKKEHTIEIDINVDEHLKEAAEKIRKEEQEKS